MRCIRCVLRTSRGKNRAEPSIAPHTSCMIIKKSGFALILSRTRQQTEHAVGTAAIFTVHRFATPFAFLVQFIA